MISAPDLEQVTAIRIRVPRAHECDGTVLIKTTPHWELDLAEAATSHAGKLGGNGSHSIRRKWIIVIESRINGLAMFIQSRSCPSFIVDGFRGLKFIVYHFL